MSDHQEAKQATPHALLLAELLDSRIPKSEREHAAKREIERLTAERDEARAERDALRIELDVCRSAIEDCYDIVETFDCYNDSDDACQRATLRQLNEAIGKAAPRLLYERPEGQKLYGLRYRELIAERDALAKEKANGAR